MLWTRAWIERWSVIRSFDVGESIEEEQIVGDLGEWRGRRGAVEWARSSTVNMDFEFLSREKNIVFSVEQA